MMSRKTIVAAIGLFLFLAGTASAQPRWGRERMPEAGACFFKDINFRGEYFCVPRGEQLRSMPSGMGDKISSIRVLGAGEVIVFKDGNMRGRSARFSRDVSDLRRGGWNDQISSIEVGGGGGGGGYPGDRGGHGGGGGGGVPVWGRNEAMPRAGACFYEDANFQGQYFCVQRGSSYASLPRGFNDRISSVRVFGARVEIFKDRDFHGRSSELRGDARNLRGNWKDDISSIRVF
jgi:Peptidase inhibitor family I36/Beta/Gamma crystallin